MNRLTTSLCVGATAPFSLLHVSDTHLAFADERDDARKNQLAIDRRTSFFPFAEENFEEIRRVAIAEQKTIVHTGDLIDFVSEKNLELARELTDSTDVFMAAGNHEFSLYVGEAFEDAAYRAQSFDKVQAIFKNPIRFAARIVNGVNLVVLDNAYYLFDQWQLDALRAEAQKGLPILLFMHTPLFTEAYYHFAVGDRGIETAANLTAVPEEILMHYNDYRYRQQKADAVTLEAVNYIRSEPLIRAVFTGHIHRDFEAPLTPTLMQYTTGLSTIREICIA